MENNPNTTPTQLRQLRRALNVRRYHTHHTTQINSVAAHSWGVAALADYICQDDSTRSLLRAALYHDVAEALTGDLPSPTKRALSSDVLQDMEDRYTNSLGVYIEPSAWETVVLKMCDILDGLLFCYEEEQRGNATLSDVKKTYTEYAKKQLAVMGRFPQLERAALRAQDVLAAAVGTDALPRASIGMLQGTGSASPTGIVQMVADTHAPTLQADTHAPTAKRAGHAPRANDMQIGGDHYEAPIQHWDFATACLGGRYMEGNISKYLCRYDKKDGLKDLRKSLHYTKKMIEMYKDGQYQPIGARSQPSGLSMSWPDNLLSWLSPPRQQPFDEKLAKAFINQYKSPEPRFRALSILVDWRGANDLSAMLACISGLIAREEANAPSAPSAGYVKQE